jgi:hypothetical protein
MTRSKARDPLVQLLERARKDPKFFHQLVFDPEGVISKVTFLSRESKSRLLAIRPENVIQSLIGRLGWCGDTCGADSCIDTCGPRSCDNTCGDSCGGTCKHSCGDTTKLELRPGDVVSQPGVFELRAAPFGAKKARSKTT